MNELSFQPGDPVYLHKAVVPTGQYCKFLRPWKAATVLRKVGDMNYRVRLEGNGKTILVHHNRLKPRDTSAVGVTQGESGVSVGLDVARVPDVGAEPGSDVDQSLVPDVGVGPTGLSSSDVYQSDVPVVGVGPTGPLGCDWPTGMMSMMWVWSQLGYPVLL